jgi:hypothetical protein
MSDPRTLGELLEWLENEGQCDSGYSCPYGLTHEMTKLVATHLRRILYGEECGHEVHASTYAIEQGAFDCPGHTGGLVERVVKEWLMTEGIAAAIRKEIGEPT